MEVSPETKLNKQSAFSYKSFGGSSQLADCSSPSDFTCESNKKHGEDTAIDLSHLPKEIPLKQLASGSPDLYERGLSNLKETNKNCSSQDTLIFVYASIIFATGVTIALILQNYLGESLVFIKGVLVSDHERCTALGQRVLHDHGSSVDAAIAATLCLGVVHPHVSGIGGGGVMLVHDIHKNETRLINFQGTAPKTLKEEMLQNGLELKAGLQVGVPGMLRGLHRAHRLYGSLSWKDVVTRAADVAKDGFNVSHSLAEAISKVEGEKLLQRFRTVFFPEGRALRPGSFLRMPSLAGVLEAGLSNFYNGDLSQEMEDEVRANGGVLSREDISDYSVQVEQPVEGLFNEFIIQVPPPPSVGAALISALNLLEEFHLSENNNTESQTYHQTAEALKASLAMASGLGDPKYNSSVTELLFDMLSKGHADVLQQRINRSNASLPERYSTVPSLQTELVAGQVVVMGPDDLMVSVASSLNGPFGSRIMTQSGVLLNSLILDFSWPSKTRGQLQTNQRNRVQPGKRPLSTLMPTMVVPARHKCGIYMALSGSDRYSLNAITQVLSALSDYKDKNDSLSLKRLYPQLQPKRLLAESEIPEESVQSLHAKGHVVQRVKPNTVDQGILRNKDIIKAIAVPQLLK